MKPRLTLTLITAALLPALAHAAPAHKAAKTAAPTQYRAVCGMIYSAAEAKKDHYICSMDGKKMTAIPPASKPAARKPKSGRAKKPPSPLSHERRGRLALYRLRQEAQ